MSDTTSRKPRRWFQWLLAGTGLLAAVFIVYLAGYYAMLIDRRLDTPYTLNGAVMVDATPVYRYPSAEPIMAPAHALDRLVRPHAWRFSEGDPMERVIDLVSPVTSKQGHTLFYESGDAHIVGRDGKIESIWEAAPFF